MTDLISLFKEKKSDTTAEDVQQVLDNDPEAAGQRDQDGRYPLYYGMENKAPAEAIAAVLAAYPDAAKEKDEDGRTALLLASEKRHTKLVKLLLVSLACLCTI